MLPVRGLLLFFVIFLGCRTLLAQEEAARPDFLAPLGSFVGVVDLNGDRNSGLEGLSISDWVDKLQAEDFIRMGSQLHPRLLEIMRQMGMSVWFTSTAEKRLYTLMSFVGLWVRSPELSSNRYGIAAHQLPIAQLRDYLLVGRGEEAQTVEFLWHPLILNQRDLQDRYPALLIELPADVVREAILQSRLSSPRLADFLLQHDPFGRCRAHFKSLGWSDF